MAQIVLLARASLIAFAAILLVGEPTSAQAQSSFDGSWSVLIVTQTGTCDRAYRYAVQIERGRVFYEGGAGVEFTGRVDRNGRVNVTVRWGNQSASGTGRLSGNRGGGSWKGRSATSDCSGSWDAERR